MTIKIRPDKLKELMDQLENALQANYSFASPQYKNPALTINGVISQSSLSF